MSDWTVELEELKGWQPILGTIFGFGALVIGALFNSHLNRRRDDRLRRQQMQSVAAALYGEMLLFRIELGRVARNLAAREVRGDSELDESFLEAHVLSDPTIYKAISTQIGLLDAELVLAITAFYKNLTETRTWLPLLLPNDKRRYGYDSSAVLRPARDAVTDIVSALRKIEKIVGAPEASSEIDLGHTDDVLEMSERRRSD